MGMDPISIGIGLLGSAVSAGGSMMAGNASANAASYQAQVAANNAIVAQQNAAWAIQSGEAQQFNEGLKGRSQIGVAKATQGASGIDVNTGSAANVRAGMATTNAANVNTIGSNAARTAYGYQVQASNFTAQSQLDTQQASADQTGGMISGLGSLLSGASSTMNNYAKYGGMVSSAVSPMGGGNLIYPTVAMDQP